MISKRAAWFLALVPVVLFAQSSLPLTGPQGVQNASDLRIGSQGASSPPSLQAGQKSLSVDGLSSARAVSQEIFGSERKESTDSSTPIFSTAVSYGSGGIEAESVAVADVNGDGKLDVIVANCAIIAGCLNQGSGDGGVGVLLGNGDGTFKPAVSYDSGAFGAESVAVADVNGDGKPDLIVANFCANDGNGDCANGSAVSVFLGNGDGTFRTAVTYGSGGFEAFSVAAADVNGDGKLDLIVAHNCPNSDSCTDGTAEGTVGVLLGNGDGTFQAAVSYDSGGVGAFSVVVGDVNGDGKPDLLVANCAGEGGVCFEGSGGSGSVGVLLGNGDGTFQTAVPYGSGGYEAHTAAVADVNGDGKPDIVVLNQCASDNNCANGTVGVLLGNGDGTFQSAVAYASGGVYSSSVTVADVNGDGKPDLLVTNQCATNPNPPCTNGSVGLLLGNGDGTFQGAVTFGSGGQNAASVAVADVNGDGKPDLLVTNQCATNPPCTNGLVGVLLNTYSRPTTTTATSSSNPSIFGQTVTFSATVTSQGSGTPTGSVTFYDGVTQLGSGQVTNNIATWTASLLSGGTHSITAIYSGDSKFSGSASNPVLQVVNEVTSTTTLISSMNPSAYGQSVSFTATVSSSGGTPSGKVEYFNGTTVLTTLTLISGSAKYTTSKLPTGSNSITAVYEGNSNVSASTSAPVDQFVVTATTVTLASSPNPSIYGQAVLFTANVNSKFGPPPNGETITFKQGTTVLGTGILSGGTATFSDSTLAVGAKSVTAVYGGDASFATSTSKTLSQVIVKATSSTTLTSSQNPSTFGQSVKLTATVAPQFSGTPTGTVTFKDGASVLGSATLNSEKATFSTTALTGGAQSITATYNASTNYSTSTSTPLTQTVNTAATSTSLVSSANPSKFGQSVTFTATVKSATSGTPTGTVTFEDGATVLGMEKLSSGKATFTTSGLTAGVHSISAVYGGNGNFIGSTSPVLKQTSNAGSPASVTATAGSGQSATISIAFATALQATVKDASGNLLANVTVTFNAPTSGASGTFANGMATSTAITNSSGIATAPAFTANSTVGSYNVTASVSGVSTPAAFSLTNNPSGVLLSITSLSQTVANPFDVLTITGSGFNSTALVNFSSTPSGFSVNVQPVFVSQTSLIVAVPVVTSGASFSSGATNVVVVESSAQSNSEQLQIAAVPAAPPSVPGTVTLGFLEGELAIANQLSSEVTPNPLPSDLAAAISALNAAIPPVQSVVNGTASSANLGTINGQPVILGATELAQMDQLLLAVLQALADTGGSGSLARAGSMPARAGNSVRGRIVPFAQPSGTGCLSDSAVAASMFQNIVSGQGTTASGIANNLVYLNNGIGISPVADGLIIDTLNLAPDAIVIVSKVTGVVFLAEVVVPAAEIYGYLATLFGVTLYVSNPAPTEANGDELLQNLISAATLNLGGNILSLLTGVGNLQRDLQNLPQGTPPNPQTTACVSALSLNFGTIAAGTTSPSQSVKLTNNSGTGSLAVTSVVVGGPNPAFWADYNETDDCSGTTLPAGASCTVIVTFTPSTGGFEPASIGIFGTSPALPITIDLSGTTSLSGTWSGTMTQSDDGCVYTGTMSWILTEVTEGGGGLLSGSFSFNETLTSGPTSCTQGDAGSDTFQGAVIGNTINLNGSSGETITATVSGSTITGTMIANGNWTYTLTNQ